MGTCVKLAEKSEIFNTSPQNDLKRLGDDCYLYKEHVARTGGKSGHLCSVFKEAILLENVQHRATKLYSFPILRMQIN